MEVLTDRTIQKKVTLKNVPETMLWTLHNRAHEAKKHDTYLKDPDCIKIYDAIDYDFLKSFGEPDDSHPMRSKIFDEALVAWLKRHPSGTVIELGAGLETQFQRCDNGSVNWFCIDVPESIDFRKEFLPENERCKYIAKSALDTSWLNEIEAENVFVSAQGLFMYFEETQVRDLLVKIVDKYLNCYIVFDTVPVWFSKKTLQGFNKTDTYTAPPMPWGINNNKIKKTIRGWNEKIYSINSKVYGVKHGFLGFLFTLIKYSPILKNSGPTVTRIKSQN